MQTKSLLAAGSLLVIAVVIIGLVANHNRQPERVVTVERIRQPGVATPPILSESRPPLEIPPVESQPQVQPPKVEAPLVQKPGMVANQSGKSSKTKPPIQDPVARAALSLVGADAAAEAYWFAAINDPTLPATERQDLIEDLNEDGLSDPKHPSPQDLPLILSRIQLIEAVAPFAWDEVNANAFAEAYQDLVNLASGKPAQ